MLPCYHVLLLFYTFLYSFPKHFRSPPISHLPLGTFKTHPYLPIPLIVLNLNLIFRFIRYISQSIESHPLYPTNHHPHHQPSPTPPTTPPSTSHVLSSPHSSPAPQSNPPLLSPSHSPHPHHPVSLPHPIGQIIPTSPSANSIKTFHGPLGCA